jgi:hypothetical protein
MTKHEEFLVPIEIAKKLKEIGFDKPCLFDYRNDNIYLEGSASVGFSLDPDNTDFVATLDQLEGTANQEGSNWVTVPTYEQVFAWFREKGLYGNIEAGSKYNSIYIFSDNDLDMGSKIYPTYEEAREELLKRLIKIYKDENNI